MIDKANETKLKFKVGDKVKFVDVINVGDTGITGVIISIDGSDYITPYLVKFYELGLRNERWLNDKCIELVNDDTDTMKIRSDGMVDKANETKHKSEAGKKVKSINCDSIDLTYNWVYDVFIDNKGDEFIIDDVDDKRYRSIYDDDYYELVDDVVDTTNDIRDTNETKPKFKVGDKVKVVDTKQISQWTKDIDVGYVGFVVDVNVNVEDTPYQVKFNEIDKYCWWFTDKCIELVNDDTDTIENNPTESAPIVSDGGSSSYYAQQIPKGMLERFNTTGTIEAKDVIRLFLGNDFNMGNFFKAYCRIISLRQGKGKAGIDEQYDLTKAKYFAEDELNYYLENKNF